MCGTGFHAVDTAGIVLHYGIGPIVFHLHQALLNSRVVAGVWTRRARRGNQDHQTGKDLNEEKETFYGHSPAVSKALY
jgi:hypothetical protein